MFVLTCCLLVWAAGFVPSRNALAEQQAAQAARPQAVLPFDPSTPLASRVILSPESALERHQNLPKSPAAFHAPTQAEREEMDTVLQQLPTFTRKVFLQHVRTISFIDGVPGNGTTSMEEGSTLPVFNIVLRAGLLHETVSEFLTRKERGYYSPATSDLTLNIEGGSLSALLYVLTHESVHVLDISNRAGQASPPRLFANSPPDLLVQGIWEDARTKVPMYESPLFQISYFGSGKLQSLDTAEPTYRMLARTPFVSLYGSSNWYDDIAELVTCYYMTQVLKQPYRIVLRTGGEIHYSLSPMENPLVQARSPKVLPLFD